MSKVCSNCGKKIGFLDQKLKFKDGKILCSDCIKKYGLSKDENHDSPTYAAISWATDYPYSYFEMLKQSGKKFSEFFAEAKAKQKADITPTNYKSPSDNPAVQKATVKINRLAIPKEIKKQLIDAQVFDFWFNNKELKTLPSILDYKNGEVIKYAASGLKEENGESRTVLILCTNRRVIFLNKNMFFGGDSTDIPLNMINSVQLRTHLLLAEIAIVNGANITTLKQLTNTSAKILSKTIKDELYKYHQQLVHPQAVEQSKPDPADEIRKFKGLADDGIITQAEFEAKKKQLLGL